MNDKKIIIFVVLVILAWTSVLYIFTNHGSDLSKKLLKTEKKKSELRMDSILSKNKSLEIDLFLEKAKSDSLIKLISKKDKKIKQIKSEDHEKSIFIDSLNSAGLYEFFAKYKTR